MQNYESGQKLQAVVTHTRSDELASNRREATIASTRITLDEIRHA